MVNKQITVHLNKLVIERLKKIDSYTIYRAENESIDINNLPPPLIAGVTVKGYTDNYVGDATSIHYRIASVKGERSKISEEYVVELGQTTEISCDGAR